MCGLRMGRFGLSSFVQVWCDTIEIPGQQELKAVEFVDCRALIIFDLRALFVCEFELQVGIL